MTGTEPQASDRIIPVDDLEELVNALETMRLEQSEKLRINVLEAADHWQIRSQQAHRIAELESAQAELDSCRARITELEEALGTERGTRTEQLDQLQAQSDGSRRMPREGPSASLPQSIHDPAQRSRLAALRARLAELDT